MLVAHGVAADLKGEDLAVADNVTQRDALCGLNGFNWLSGGDAAQQRQAFRALPAGACGQDVDGTAAVVRPLQQAFVLQIRDVLMHGGQRTEAQATGYFLIGRGVAVFLREAGKKVDDLFLPPSDSHAEIVANKKRIAIPLLILS